MTRFLLLFTLVGPLIASVTVSFFVSVFSFISHAGDDKYVSVIEGVVASVLFSPIVGLLGYPLAIMLGAVPAILSGGLYWTILKFRTRQNPTQTKRLIIGGCIGFFVCLFFIIIFSIVKNEEYSIMFLGWAMVGAVASAFCSLLISNKCYSSCFKNHRRE